MKNVKLQVLLTVYPPPYKKLLLPFTEVSPGGGGEIHEIFLHKT